MMGTALECPCVCAIETLCFLFSMQNSCKNIKITSSTIKDISAVYC
jgi:hypothetical protein